MSRNTAVKRERISFFLPTSNSQETSANKGIIFILYMWIWLCVCACQWFWERREAMCGMICLRRLKRWWWYAFKIFYIYVSSNAWLWLHIAQLILRYSLEIREIIVILIEDSVLSLASTIIESRRCSFVWSAVVFECSLASAGIIIVNCSIGGRLMKVVSSWSRIELSWFVWIVCLLWVIEVLIISELFFGIFELIWWHKEGQELCLRSQQILLLLWSQLLLLLWCQEALWQ